MPEVSIIIPCFNLGQFLDDAVSSVENQTYNNWEIIIVDDGSTEKETLEVLKRIETEKPYQVIRQKNSGPAAARNRGIEGSQGEYIICLDADDMLTPTYLEKTVKLIEKSDSKTAFVTTWLQEFGARRGIWKTSPYNIPEMLVTNLVHAGSLFKKKIWAEVGGFNINRNLQGYEDWGFWLSVVEKGYRWEVVKEPLFLYRIRENSLLASAKAAHMKKYSLIYDLHEKLFQQNSKGLVFENSKEMKQLHEVIAEKNMTINELEKYKDEVLSLRAQLFETRDELHNLKNSRVFGKIIKLRNFIGVARKALRPNNILHKVRVRVAPFIPRPIRLVIKKIAKKLLKRAPDKPRQIYISNEKHSHPLVSVIVPYYNRVGTIDHTIDSLKDQSFKDFEVLIVDDGSTDEESIKKLENINSGELTLKIISQENSGVAAARNNGISKARGKYIICLDSDDALDPTYIEKCTAVLETSPDTSLVTTHMQTFGIVNEVYKHLPYNALDIRTNNMVITAAEFRKEAWQKSGGYKSNIGYEDWEFWVNLAEKGFWGKSMSEPLFRYRTSMQSRYVEDKDLHWRNMNTIKVLHPKYNTNVKKLIRQRQNDAKVVKPDTAFINLNNKAFYTQTKNNKKNILVALPWMTFGGAETLILNFCKEIKDSYNLSFITGLKSDHEWEYKFREVSSRIYHLSNLFDSKNLYLEFVSNYIKTRDIDILHIIHTSEFFNMLPEIKSRHPDLKVVVTVFNDRAAHFYNAIPVQDKIDVFTTDNEAVRAHYNQKLSVGKRVEVIPNGINCYDIFNPALFDRNRQREELKVGIKDLAVFFIGRLSEEKNPDVFCGVAEDILAKRKLSGYKFFIIGDGPMKPHIFKKIEHLKTPKITYLGYQSEIAKYLSAADVFVLPSSIEGFPLSILEAMAMRVVVVASEVGAVAEVVKSGEEGIVVPAGSQTDIVAAIMELKSNPSELARFKRNARKKVENKYSNTLLGQNYKKLYRDFTK